jgi:hypothetical protein
MLRKGYKGREKRNLDEQLDEINDSDQLKEAGK